MIRASTLLLLVLACAGLVACGSSSSSAESSMERKVAELEAKEKEEAGVTTGFNVEAHWTIPYSYTRDEVTTKAGKARVAFTNPQTRVHDVAIEDPEGRTIGQSKAFADDAEFFIVQLHPGVYHYYCTLPGHREKGMEGTLRVTK